MFAIFNFQSLLIVALLLLCTCTYLRVLFPSILKKKKDRGYEVLLEMCKEMCKGR